MYMLEGCVLRKFGSHCTVGIHIFACESYCISAVAISFIVGVQ